jgi:hypothetical protein
MKGGHTEGFMTEKEMFDHYSRNKVFTTPSKIPRLGTYPYPIIQWFKVNNDHKRAVGHHDKIGEFDCDQLTDKWFEWALPLPAPVNPIGMSSSGYGLGNSDTENVHLFKSGDAAVYFVAISPARSPDRVRIVITKQHPVLIPIYWVISSEAENPSLKEEGEEGFMRLVKNDLNGIQHINVFFDEEPVHGCTVIRNIPLRIPNIPKNNVLGIPHERLLESDYAIEIYHGGLWLLLKADNFSSGDHQVTFQARARNYEMDGSIWISALV